MARCKYPDEVCASMTTLNGETYCDSVPCVLRDEMPPHTNADRIRRMSDEELRKFLFDFQLEAITGFMSKGGLGCKDSVQLLDWLRQPAKEETE